MSRSSEPGFAEALQAVIEALGELTTPSMVIGGVAVIALGVPRFTSDIDVTIQGRSNHPEQVFGAFSHHEIGPRIESALEFAKARQVILALHGPSGISIDASLAWLPFEEEAIQSSLATEFAGVSIRVPRPEDLVIYKLVACRPQDVEDAEGLLLLYGREMNLGRVRGLIQQFSEVLDNSIHSETLERLLRKTLGG